MKQLLVAGLNSEFRILNSVIFAVSKEGPGCIESTTAGTARP